MFFLNAWTVTSIKPQMTSSETPKSVYFNSEYILYSRANTQTLFSSWQMERTLTSLWGFVLVTVYCSETAKNPTNFTETEPKLLQIEKHLLKAKVSYLGVFQLLFFHRYKKFSSFWVFPLTKNQCIKTAYNTIRREEKRMKLRGLFDLRCHRPLKNVPLISATWNFYIPSKSSLLVWMQISSLLHQFLKRPLVVGFRQTGQLWSYSFGEVLYPVKLTPTSFSFKTGNSQKSHGAKSGLKGGGPKLGSLAHSGRSWWPLPYGHWHCYGVHFFQAQLFETHL